MEYFIFKGTSSEDIGIVISEMAPVTKSEKDIESITITGRNGDLHIDNGTYRSKKYKIKCVCVDTTKINDIKTLCEGTGALELSTELGKEYTATICNQIDFEKYLTYLKEFALQFELHPVAYSKTTIEETYTEDSEFDVSGTFGSSPIMIVNGVGTITLNNTQVQVEETGITIDCELMNCTKESINKNDKVILDEFPSLVVGENVLVLGEGITSVELSYKEGWL